MYEDCAEHTPVLHHRVDRGQDVLSTVPRYRVGAKPTDRRKLDHELVELWCPAAARRTAPATSTPRSPPSRNNSAAAVVGAQALPRPILTSSRPSTGRQDRHNLELGPVGPAGQALLAAGRVRLDCDGDIGRTDADPARSARRGEVPASAQWCVDGGDDGGFLARCIRWSCRRVGLTGSRRWSVGAVGCRAGW